MWILPKNLHTSAYVPDTVALISDLNEQSEMCAQSLLVRSKPMRQQTWSKKWKRDSWTQLLFGRILKHSHGKIFTEKWTSSVEASLASHSVTQVGKQEMMTLDTCGPTSSEASNNWDDLPLFSSKMWKESSTQSSSQMAGQIPSERPFCSMSLGSWKKWVTKQRQAYLARAKSVRHSCEKESLYLQYQTNSNQVELILSQVSSTDKNWATPNTMDHLTPKSTETLIRQDTTVRKGRTAPSNLREQVDPKAVGIYQQLNVTAQETTEQHTHLLEDNSSTDMRPQEQSPKGYLNPRWVEQLMGLPVGWAKASCSVVTITEQMSLDCLETELCLTQPQERSDSYGKNWPTPNARDWKDTLNTVPPCAGKTRGWGLGQALAAELQKNRNWPTPAARDWKDSHTIPPCVGKTRGLTLGQSLIEEAQQTKQKNWTTPTSREVRADGVTLDTLIRKDGKHRLDQLGIQVRFDETDVEEAYKKKWSTPPASQRGEDLEVYFRKSIDRVKNGGVKFAPTLQVQVEAEQKKISLDFADHDIDLSIDTETLVKKIMGVHYKKEEDQ